MAETTFAVTQTKPGLPAPVVYADRENLARGVVELGENQRSERACVSSGRVIDGCQLRVISEDGRLLSDDKIGELEVTSVSLSSGYRNWPEKTAEAFHDGWYKTGDLGFTHDGEVFVIGRKKDVIIVAGKNIYPEDIEDTVGRVSGVIPGRVVAFGIEDTELGTEKICVAAESALPDREHAALIAAIRDAGSAIDLTISDVHVVPPRWLIKSSAGKPSRSANRSRLLKRADTTTGAL